ncbi:MAG: nitrilase-related carbon-nitrogen hydrolase, partial [Candidatus Phytoplasma australasiaticum]|nr:nitrilase-related carbon-nitrogen hydrolase [Candidatus Phytoplasma australasiaticum]
FIVFPELCLSGYTSGDLFFDRSFLKENLKSLNFLIKNTNYKGVYLLGMPIEVHSSIFNVAIVVQDKKILGIVPKKTIPNYKEFKEKRWFQSGKDIVTQKIELLEQNVLFGDILFINKKFNIIFGVEICQDLWTIESPSDLMVLNGAHLIFNLSASSEHIGKIEPRRIAVIDHSRKQIGGYFYTSSGITEKTTEIVCSNHKIASVMGNILGEKDFLNNDENLIVDVDIDSIKHQRIIDTTFGEQKQKKIFPFFYSN